jgi:hypothetical protein
VKFTRALSADHCANCRELEHAHEWRCTRCGVQSLELDTCGCGAEHFPKPACECHSAWGLFCPAAKRRITRAQWEEQQHIRELHANVPDWNELAKVWTWEWEEAERLWKAALS